MTAALASIHHGNHSIDIIEDGAPWNENSGLSMNCWTTLPGTSEISGGSPFRADQVVEVRRTAGSSSGRITIKKSETMESGEFQANAITGPWESVPGSSAITFADLVSAHAR